MADSRQDRVRGRYDDLLRFFELQWRDHDHQSVHFGYYDEVHTEPASAMVNTTRQLADVAEIDGADLVIDVGCGAGGDAVWLARERGARVLGVDLVPDQLQQAYEHATAAGVEDRVAFREADFHELDVAEAGQIDVAWALESLSHSPDPPAALAAIRDVLAADGRLVVGDVFLREPDPADRYRETLASIESSMGLEFQPIEKFATMLEDAGFPDVELRDVTPAIMPGADRSLDTSSLLGPLARAGSSLGVSSDAIAAYLDFWSDVHELLEADVAGYYFFRGDASERP